MMKLVFTVCAGILSAAPGCREHTVPLVVDVIPAGCAAKVQATVAERADLQAGRVVRYACARRHRQEAEAAAHD